MVDVVGTGSLEATPQDQALRLGMDGNLRFLDARRSAWIAPPTSRLVSL